MRAKGTWILAAALAWSVGCGDPVVSGPASDAGASTLDLAVVGPEDGIVLNVVLDDLLGSKEFRTYPSWSTKPQVIVWDTTEGLSWSITTGQLSSELRDLPPVSMELYNNLKARNSRKVSLGAIAFGSVRMGSSESVPKGERFAAVFEEKFPKARAFVGFWLPAYGSEEDSALVRFRFGPTAHGACGTYLLEKTKGTWRISWRKLSYYV